MANSRDTKDSYTEVYADLRALGLTLFPLKPRSKEPAHDGWRTRDYSDFDPEAWRRRGGSVGIRLGADQLVVDVDPRNGGDVMDLELDLGVLGHRTLTTLTGGNGLHFHYRKPPGQRITGKVKGYPGVDVKTAGGFVVGPGSIHPETGKVYAVAGSIPDAIPAAPRALFAAIKRRPAAPRRDDMNITSDRLGALLAALDPREFGKGHHDDFVALMAACHEVTGGDGREAFLDWAAGDPDYGTDATETNGDRWDTFESGKPGGAGIGTIRKFLVDAGRADIVATMDQIAAADDFEDEEEDGDDEDGRPGTVQKTGLTIVSAGSVERRNIEWLWPGRIALGKVTGIAGVPDQGKSQVAAHIAAIVTTGGQWPDGGRSPAGSVLMLCAEDDAADTTVPRLDAAGADRSKIGLVDALVRVKDGKRMFSFKDDLPRLTKAVEARPDLKLIIVDPISAYMGSGSVDTFKNSDVRGVLAPLADLAAKAGVAVLFVTHFNKGGTGSALNRVTDSLAFTALARSFWAVLLEVDNGIATGRKLLVRIKQNIAAPVGGLAYEIEGVTLSDGVETSRVRWDGPIDMTADEVWPRNMRSPPRRNATKPSPSSSPSWRLAP